MAACNNTALTDFELHWIDDGYRKLGLREYRNCASTRQRFADFTRILSWQLDHTVSLAGGGGWSSFYNVRDDFKARLGSHPF